MKRNMFYEGDAIELMQKMPGESIDAVFIDPPMTLPRKYRNEYSSMQVRDYLNWCEKWMLESIRITKPSGSIFIHGIPRWLVNYSTFLNSLVDFKHWIVWNTTVAPMGSSLQPSHYGILYYAKDKNKTKFYELRSPHPVCRDCGTVLKNYGGRKNNMHEFGALLTDTWSDIHRVRHPICTNGPSQLPVHLLERILLMSTDEGDVVLDPFARTGTTGIAAKKLGRDYILFDKSMENKTIATQRLRAGTSTVESKLGTSWISFYLGRMLTIRDVDWKSLRPYCDIPNELKQILDQEISHPCKGTLFEA